MSTPKPTRKPRAPSRKNIREAYIDYMKQSNGLKKSQSISNLEKYDPKTIASSSNYLEDQYSLVKRIITATSALEKLKKSARDGFSDNSNNNDIRTSRSTISGTPLYKTQEEYYEEVMSLKKKLKNLEKNETIMKAKIEYYENELTKKYQEIEELLDAKAGDKTSNLKSDYRQTIGLKKKNHKLELQLKEKENKLKTLESDLKTTSIREMRINNDIMKQEIQRLNECLLNSVRLNPSNLGLLSDRSFNKENINSQNAFEIQFHALKNENKNLNERLEKILNDKNYQNHENLKKILQNKDEEIAQLKEKLNKHDSSSWSDDRSSRSNSRSSSKNSKISTNKKPLNSIIDIKESIVNASSLIVKRSPSPAPSINKNNNNHKQSEVELLQAVDVLQSVFRGHNERLKFNNELNKQDTKLNSFKNKPIDSQLIEHKKQPPSQSPSRNRLNSRSPSLSRRNDNSIITNSTPKKEKQKIDSDDDDLSMD